MSAITSLSTIFIVLLLVVSGCAGKEASPVDEASQAFDDVQAEIRSAVTDPEREKKALELLSAVRQSFIEARVTSQANNEQFGKRFANYDSTRDELQSVLVKIREEDILHQKTWTNYHRQMVDVLTEEEWAEIQKSHTEAMSAALKTLEYR